MANRVVVSPQADLDVDAAWLFIAERNLIAANELIDRITEASQTLASAPKMGRLRPELRSRLRSFPVENYLIFYIEIFGGIEILRIMHARRNVGRSDLT